MSEATQNQILPNSRYGAAFLDYKYKKYAALGEVIMDKITGEMLLKRKVDGKIISFVQNDKYIHDIILELDILMKNNTSFTFPNDNDSWFLSTDFNITDMNGGNEHDVIADSEILFSNSAIDETRRFQFFASRESNGFFIRPIARDTDKNALNYTTNLYNSVFQYYAGSNLDFTAERAKFADSSYYDSNATISYEIKVTGKNDLEDVTRTYSQTAYIRADDENLLSFPDNFKTGMTSITNILVSINSIIFNKVDKVLEWIASDPSFDTSIYESMLAPDGRLVIKAVNVFSFVDDSESIRINDNVVITAMVDTIFVASYLGRINKMSDGSGFISMVARPGDDMWTTHNAWGEIIRIVKTAGQSSETAHETDLTALEEMIYKTSGVTVNFSFNANDVDDIYLEEVASNSLSETEGE